MPLTPSQELAVKLKGKNLQIIACAGSGKTEVVARRVARLIAEGKPSGLHPRNFIAFTFTERAASELKERIGVRVRELCGDVPGLAELYVGTIHGFCLELIKSEVPQFLKYSVLNETQRTLFIDRHSRTSGLTESTRLTGEKLQRYKHTKVYCKAVDILREDQVDHSQLADNSVARGLASYRAVLEKNAYLDYSEMLSIAAKELETNGALQKRVKDRVKYLVVDEYQDVNPVQERIIRAIHDLGAELCVVGDDDQTIYQWRGSDVGNIISFSSRYPEVSTVRLEENFRSTSEIVQLAKEFIRANPTRLLKEMRGTAAQHYEAGDILAISFSTPEEEATFIARKIKELLGMPIRDGSTTRGISYSDIAVLLRSVSRNGEAIVAAFRREGVPYVVIGLNGLFTALEAIAARTTFYWLADYQGTTEAMTEAAWRAADLAIDSNRMRAALQYASETKHDIKHTGGKRFGLYSLQRTYLGILERLGVSESSVPSGRGELVFYNLGKFSQVISDFEQIHFHSDPAKKYQSFAEFLDFKAEDSYAEGGTDEQRASPDAVKIMTVHQAKGLQWPAVFLPALIRNRFPAAGIGGLNTWHLLPTSAIANAQRYQGGVEDERRLFYVAMTRSQKFLFMSWAPIAGNRRFKVASAFLETIRSSPTVKRHDVPLSSRGPRLRPQPKQTVASVVLSFSDLKYFFECPYQFKLRVLYGFNAPIHEALGYGKSLHDCLAEVHSRAMAGDYMTPEDAPELVNRHLHTPFAYPALRQTLATAATGSIADYLRERRLDLPRIEFSEQPIELELGDSVRVVGRIDLVRRTDTERTSIVDLKSSDTAQDESLTERQLHIYALGYQQLTGRPADLVEIYNLDDQSCKARSVDDYFIDQVRREVGDAASSMRTGTFVPAPSKARCSACDMRSLCAHRIP